jgi:hypothetical protein
MSDGLVTVKTALHCSLKRKTGQAMTLFLCVDDGRELLLSMRDGQSGGKAL